MRIVVGVANQSPEVEQNDIERTHVLRREDTEMQTGASDMHAPAVATSTLRRRRMKDDNRN